MDGDGTYPAEMIPLMAEMLQHHDVVTGVRDTGREHISPLNRLGNSLFRRAISFAARTPVQDPLTGLYGLRRRALDRLNLRSDGFGIEAEIVIKAGRQGMSILELPIEYRERIGSSKLNPWRDGMIISGTITTLMFGLEPGVPVSSTVAASAETAEPLGLA
jgi:hypothetical protein